MIVSNNSHLVSITIATYNVAPFVAKSLECMVNQSLRDIEILCVDDGSTDGTLQILQDFASKDNRIRIISKEKNEGLAVARNLSLQEARGKYVAFVDGDDLMDVTLFQKAYELAEKEQSDMVLWDYHVFYKEEELEQKEITSILSIINPENKVALLQRPAFAWLKLIRTEKARELGIHFPVGLTRQDIPVHWHLIISLGKISLLSEKLSYYRQQPDATTAQKGKKLLDIALVMDETKKVLEKTGNWEQFKDEFHQQQLNLLHGMYDNVREEFKSQALKEIIARLTEDHHQYINSTKPLRKQARLFYQAEQGNGLSAIKYKAWEASRAVYRGLKAIVN